MMKHVIGGWVKCQLIDESSFDAYSDVRRAELGLPTEKELKEMQSKELNHGRAAMIGIAGMVVQELVTGEKLF